MEWPERKPLRLPAYDYGQDGCYFVTVCAVGKRKLFWERVGADTIRPHALPLSAIGRITEQAIRDIPVYYPQIMLEKWVVMPNHIHLLLRFEREDGRMISAPTRSLSTVVGQMKRAVSRQVGAPVWQKGFYEHIVRNDQDFLEIWTYIENNPAHWAEDCYYMEMTV